MHSFFIQYVFLILIILALVMIADRLRLAYPIVLVVGGLALSFTHQFSHIAIDPELVFFIFLPPLLYEAAWRTSWKEFWRWRRLIASFAFLIVIITASVVAFAAYALIPGFRYYEAADGWHGVLDYAVMRGSRLCSWVELPSFVAISVSQVSFKRA